MSGEEKLEDDNSGVEDMRHTLIFAKWVNAQYYGQNDAVVGNCKNTFVMSSIPV